VSRSYLAKVLLLGLALSQILGTLQVYWSNGELYQKLVAFQNHGYLIIPNQKIMNGLLDFGPAFWGGLFFTLSIGAGLSVFSYVAAWLWDPIFSRKKVVLILFLLAWLFCLIKVNLKQILPLITLYFLIVPVAVFVATLRWMPQESRRGICLNRFLLLLPIVLLGILWMVLINRNVFLGFRDRFFLTHPVGVKINDFYYQYSLYPAEALKTLDQKTLKAADLEEIKKESIKPILEKALLNHNYLNVGHRSWVDLKVREAENILIFESGEKRILEVSAKDFFSKAESILEDFSTKTDRLSFFRRFTLFSFLIGFPLVIYGLLFSLFRLVINLFLNSAISSIIASILCFAIGMGFLFPLYLAQNEKIDEKDLTKAIESERWQIRVAALRFFEEKKMEIGDFPVYKRMLSSPYILERCSLVRALSVSRKEGTLKDLILLLDDPSHNVMALAFYALGQRGDTSVIHEMIKRIETSDYWYAQLYAYHALTRLGWRQTASK
jgi:Ca2+/Na+ antiporter